MPLISVIISVYNVEDTLEAALNSLIAQSYQDWECVICDDGSRDRSYQIMQGYSQRYPGKFTLLQNETNCGLAHALNRCLRECRGEFIARMDGDDISEPERLEREVAYLASHPEVAVVGCQMTRFDEHGGGKVLSPKEFPQNKDLIPGVPFFHATILMRRCVYDDLGGYNEKIRRSEDYDLWFRFFARGYRGVSLQEPLYRYRENLATVKRRTFAARWEFMMVQFRGYRLLGMPWYAYFYPPIGLMKYFVPSRLVLLYRRVHI